jgi:phosphoglycolate phosphatase
MVGPVSLTPFAINEEPAMFDLVMLDLEGVLIDAVPSLAVIDAAATTSTREFAAARRTQVCAGTERALMRLHSANARIALVTHHDAEHVGTVLDAHRLRYWFDLIVAGDTLPARTPEPLPLTYCLDSFAIRPRRALLVANTASAIAAARAAGVAVWGTSHARKVPGQVAPDRVIDDLSVVAAAVEGARLRVA